MAHDDVVFSALAYRRNVGADLEHIRRYVWSREAKEGTPAKDARALKSLAKKGLCVQVGERWYLTATGYEQARGGALPGEWERGDAWILLSVLMSPDPCTLADVVAVADYINHAIPSVAELHGALNRCVAAKLLKVRKSGYSVTDLARELQSKVAATTPRGPLHQLGGLEKILDCPHCGVRLGKVRFRPYVDQPKWEQALETYRADRAPAGPPATARV